MRVWLVTVGEPLPTDNGARLIRAGALAGLLVEKGHEVIWWSSTFNHDHKSLRFNDTTTLDVGDKYKLILLHGIPYTKNISLKRLINHRGIAKSFRSLAGLKHPPDVILSSMPTIELALEASLYGKEHNVPVILDMRDMWPETFVNVVPNLFKGLAKFLLKPMFASLHKACINARAITGITPGFVDWGLSYAGRQKTIYDRDFPLAYSSFSPKENEVISAEKFWGNLGINKNDQQFIVCFFGTIRPQIEIQTICEAARILINKKIPVKFVICGSGDQMEYYREMMAKESNILFPGWVGKNEIWTLMRIAQVGLAPYRSTVDFMMSLPNKVIEYLSAGLPIVSSLKGDLAHLLSTYKCGITYSNDDGVGLADKLVALYRDPQLVAELSSNAYDVYNSKFVAENVYRDMISYLETIAQSGQRNSQ